MQDTNCRFSNLSVMPVVGEWSTSERRTRWHPQFRGPLWLRRAGEKEAFALGLICALDMYTTLYWVVFGHAVEANQLLAWTFQHHPVLFVIVKGVSCIPALVLAPRLARRHPRFAVWLLRAVILAYLWAYLAFVR